MTDETGPIDKSAQSSRTEDQLATNENVQTSECGRRARVFISYKRNVDPDEGIALRVFEALNGSHDVFIDQNLPVGTRWAERIEAELSESDFLISFLSKESVNSEMVQGEIETAHRLLKENGNPIILPVRLSFREPFRYPLSAYLNHINWAIWNGPGDTEGLISELVEAISGTSLPIGGCKKKEVVKLGAAHKIPFPSASAQPAFVEMPEGTMKAESQFYIMRASDHIAINTMKQLGITITIKGPRQMGKSSMLIRSMDVAVKAGKRVAFLDFQLIDKAALKNPDIFFKQFCSWVTDTLEMEDRVSEYWQSPLGNSQRCTRYIGRYILTELAKPLVLAMDEVDSIFEADFRSDFFSMLRSWHNMRATLPTWKGLDLALVTSTEPYQLIENLNQSPFNVGQVIELEDLSPRQVADLNQRHGSPLTTEQLQEMMNLLNGHPYLIRRALYLITVENQSLGEILKSAIADRGPFGDHLRYHLFRLHKKEELIDGFKQILRNNSCQDELVFFRLRGAGLVRREGSKEVKPRCKLYADYFKEHLHV